MAAEVSNDIVAGFEDGTVRLLQYGKSTTNMRPVFSFILLDGAMESSANQRSFVKHQFENLFKPLHYSSSSS